MKEVYSRAPCLGADQKARGLWEGDGCHVIETLKLINTISNQSVHVFSLGCFLNTFSLYSCVLNEGENLSFVCFIVSIILCMPTFSWFFFYLMVENFDTFLHQSFCPGAGSGSRDIDFCVFFSRKCQNPHPLLAWFPPPVPRAKHW